MSMNGSFSVFIGVLFSKDTISCSSTVHYVLGKLNAFFITSDIRADSCRISFSES